jgi:uncharacterized protein
MDFTFLYLGVTGTTWPRNSQRARSALEYTKGKHLKVEVVCPVVFHFVPKHPEYKPLVGIRGYR